jgi:hypothetical protein
MRDGICRSADMGRRVPPYLCEQMRQVLSTLPPREEMILRTHFGIGRRAAALDELSRQFSLTCEHLRRIEMEALRKVRERPRSLYPRATYANEPRRRLPASQGPQSNTRKP